MSQKQAFVFILVTVLCFISEVVLAHKEYQCVHDKRHKGPDQPVLKLSRFERRMRQSAKLFDSPIRIHLDDSNLGSVGRERELILKIMSK